jgi:hypothetical protein
MLVFADFYNIFRDTISRAAFNRERDAAVIAFSGRRSVASLVLFSQIGAVLPSAELLRKLQWRARASAVRTLAPMPLSAGSQCNDPVAV